MILCTQDDKEFILYKKDIDNKKVRFKIQVIFSKWWSIFLKTYKHLNIRQVVLDNVDRMINCKIGNLGFHIFKCPECNRTLNVACTCKSNGNTAMSFSLFLLNFADSLEKIEID